MVRQGIDRLRMGDAGVSVRLEPVFDTIYGLSDEDFLDLMEQLSFVYGYQHLGTEDCQQLLSKRMSSGLRAASETLARDVGD